MPSAPSCNPLIPGSWGHKILKLLDIRSREHWETFDVVPLSNHMNLWYSIKSIKIPPTIQFLCRQGIVEVVFPSMCLLVTFNSNVCITSGGELDFFFFFFFYSRPGLRSVCIWRVRVYAHVPSEPNPNTLPACYCQMSACRQRVSPLSVDL